MNPADPKIPKVDRVEVHAAQPEPADLRRLAKLAEDRKATLAPVTWLHKLYLPVMPEPRGAALELFVGDTQVKRYSEFPGGIYFTIHDPELMRELAGKPIRFRHEGEPQAVDTGQRMPTEEERTRARASGDLPRQLELLRK